jgi:hypothetical protein
MPNNRRVYERDTDAMFLRLLRERSDFSAFITNLVAGATPDGAARVEGQRRHLRHTGSIDLALSYPNGPLILIENKIDAAYSVTREGHGQPQRYQATVAAYRAQGLEVYSVLLAPEHYLKSSRLADMFDRRVAYESLREAVDATDLALLETAIKQAEAPYEPLSDKGASNFFALIRRLIAEHCPDLVMKRDPNAEGVRPADSRTVYFDVPKTLTRHAGVPRPRMSLQCWDSGAPSASVKITLTGLAYVAKRLRVPHGLADVGGYLRPAGRSLGIVIDTPRLDTQNSFAEQVDNVIEALEAALRLQKWWDDSAALLTQWSQEQVWAG